ncbi:MAG TPA: putative manganese-dependent inorganic diphosphatase [Spirochaetota bacterium]|nr:putative manganese-dependent inorganic diphosphatase [Spirochaetota bacterium]
MEDIIVIGHKNPDTDSICAAYCYAQLKNSVDSTNRYRAFRCGNINRQTRFVFEQIGLQPPDLINNVYPKVNDIMTKNVITAYADDPLYSIIKHLEQDRIRIIPIVDNTNRFKGIVSFNELAQFYFPVTSIAKPVYLFKPQNFNLTIPGRFIQQGKDKEFEAAIVIGAMESTRSIAELHNAIPEKTVLLVGDRKEIIEFAIKNNFAALLITGVNDFTYDTTHYKGWIYLSEIDTYNTLRMLTLSIPCHSIMQDADTLSPDVSVEQAREQLLLNEYRGLPVCDNTILKGIITRSDIIKHYAKKVILVDHNELSQAVDGTQTAHIIEIIDHHRLGSLKTTTPIFVYSKPVGSTCTLVYELFKYNNIKPEPHIALLLCSGILSDTTMLLSPTTTETDKKILEELAAIAGINYNDYGKKLLSSTESLETIDPIYAVSNDCKIYEEHGIAVAISQVEVITLDDIHEVKESLLSALVQFAQSKNVHWALLLVTDITTQNSILLSTSFKGEVHLSYPPIEPHIYNLPGILSRKKQLLPEILRILEELSHK